MTSATALPSPPSNIVVLEGDDAPGFLDGRMTASVSMGLMVCMLITRTLSPSFSLRNLAASSGLEHGDAAADQGDVRSRMKFTALPI